jgi:hypothetical protein
LKVVEDGVENLQDVSDMATQDLRKGDELS